jgi:hypothetical protein
MWTLEWPILIAYSSATAGGHHLLPSFLSRCYSAGGHTALYLLRLTSTLFREKQRQMLLYLNDLGYSKRNGYNDFVGKKKKKNAVLLCQSRNGPLLYKLSVRASAGLVCINFIGVCCQAQKFNFFLSYPLYPYKEMVRPVSVSNGQLPTASECIKMNAQKLIVIELNCRKYCIGIII